MKQNLQRTSEWIELFLNYAVVFGIEIALNALIGDRVPVRVWRHTVPGCDNPGIDGRIPDRQAEGRACL